MSRYSFGEFVPQINESCFVAPDATIIGNVTMKADSSLWYKCVVRGDLALIEIGKNTNVQDMSMLHVEVNSPLILGDNVTIGHSVILHACTIEDNCLIGMGATILDRAVIGKGSVVAAGSVVPPGKTYEPYSMIMGSPAKVVRPLREDEIEKYSNHYKNYLKAKKAYLDESIVKAI